MVCPSALYVLRLSNGTSRTFSIIFLNNFLFFYGEHLHFDVFVSKLDKWHHYILLPSSLYIYIYMGNANAHTL